jgi:hypothetical protein
MSRFISAPVVLFVFNRPEKTGRVLAALREQSRRPPKLIVFSDGPRSLEDEADVAAVRSIINSLTWTEVELFERQRNMGCAQSIISGLTDVFRSHERAVMLEDDTMPGRTWYESLCMMLDCYADIRQVFAVGGYPSIESKALGDYPFDVILSPRFSCWGWGTWADRWHGIAEDLRQFRNPFESPDNVPLHAGFDLRDGAQAVANRPGFYWDLPLALLCLHLGLLHALTRYYLINNIGTDGTGTHGNVPPALIKFMAENNQIQERLPVAFPPVSLREDVCQAVQQYVKDSASAAIPPRKRQSILGTLRGLCANGGSGENGRYTVIPDCPRSCQTDTGSIAAQQSNS